MLRAEILFKGVYPPRRSKKSLFSGIFLRKSIGVMQLIFFPNDCVHFREHFNFFIHENTIEWLNK